MSVYPSVTKSVFRSVHKSLKVPPAVAGSSGGGGAFDPDLSGIQSRILDDGTIWTDAISSKYYLKDQSTDNTHLPRQGRCWLFDGVNDYGAIGNPLISGTGDFTISIWVNPTNFSADRSILATYSAGNLTGFDLYITTSGTISIYSSLGARTSTTALTSGVWNHLVVTRSSGTLTFYKNSVNAGSGAYNHNLGSASNLKVGSVFGTSEFFLGSLRDIRIYSSAKDSTAVTAIYNQSPTGNGAFDETNLVACYPCNEESGTTGYDISGNANHLTLTNITEATFHATDTGVLTNRNNDEGYRLSGSVYIPKRLSSSLAADGNALTVTGRAAYHGCAETPCVTSNGTSLYINLGSAVFPATSDFEVSFWFYRGANGSVTYLVGQDSSIRVFANASNQLGMWDGAAFYYTGSNTVIPNSWNHVRITRVGNVFSTFLNTSSTGTVTTAATFSTAQNTMLLTTVGVYSDGRIADFRITTGGATTYFPLQDGPGSSNTNRDIAWVKSDGTGGVISNAIVNGTVSTIWGNRVPGNVEDWCVKYGGRIGAAGEYIAGLIGSANAADGSAKTLSAGKYGNPYSRLNSNPATAAEFNGRSVPTAGEVGDLINGTITPDDTGFNRVDTDGDDRFLIYEDTLTGADLTNVENYVS